MNKMKKQNLFKCIAFMFLFSGCAGEQSIYEKSISDFIQTDKRGTWTDMKFKVIEMGDPVDITIGDSIRILTDMFATEKAKRLSFLTENIKRNMEGRDKESLPTMKKFHQKMIDENQAVADSISKMTVVLPENYQDKPETQILAREVRCKFSIETVYGKQEMTETFILNGDGSKCYKMKSR